MVLVPPMVNYFWVLEQPLPQQISEGRKDSTYLTTKDPDDHGCP